MININIGFLGLLTLLFIGLKLTHYIDWSWVFIFMPLWFIPASILLFLGFFSWLIYILELSNSVKRKYKTMRLKKRIKDESQK